MMIQAIQENHAKKTNHHLPNLTYNLKSGGTEKVWIVFQSNFIYYVRNTNDYFLWN